MADQTQSHFTATEKNYLDKRYRKLSSIWGYDIQTPPGEGSEHGAYEMAAHESSAYHILTRRSGIIMRTLAALRPGPQRYLEPTTKRNAMEDNSFQESDVEGCDVSTFAEAGVLLGAYLARPLEPEKTRVRVLHLLNVLADDRVLCSGSYSAFTVVLAANIMLAMSMRELPVGYHNKLEKLMNKVGEVMSYC
jgi:hypothetical protein